jgi:adenylate cyclase, class 2
MQEIEAKFYVGDLGKIESRIRELDARLFQSRVLEMNIRFDLPDARLRSEGRVLRLRRDTNARLTYKDSGKSEQGVVNRTEIEFTVEDFEKAKLFLEALGYQKLFEYEKYRTTYELHQTSKVSTDLGGLAHVMLDELPYGNFVEIEGKDIATIHSSANKLNLDLNVSIPASYSALFERVRSSLRLTFTDLTFENFEGIEVTPEHLLVQPADK